MYKAAIRFMIRRSMRALNEGDIRPLMQGYADDVEFTFPGESRWGGTYRGKAEVEGFLRSFLAAGLKAYPTDILINGSPWNTRICIVSTDDARDADGNVVYDNRYVIYGRIAWGKIRQYEVYEDTVKSMAFDDYLTKIGNHA